MPNIFIKHIRLSVALVGAALLAVSPTLAAKPKKAAARHQHAAPVMDQDTLSTWHQDTALLQRLDLGYPMGVFSIRPPTGYTLVQKNTQRKTDYVSRYDWYGDGPTGDASDDDKPSLEVQITKLKPHMVTLVTMDDRLTQLLQDLKKDAPWI